MYVHITCCYYCFVAWSSPAGYAQDALLLQKQAYLLDPAISWLCTSGAHAYAGHSVLVATASGTTTRLDRLDQGLARCACTVPGHVAAVVQWPPLAAASASAHAAIEGSLVSLYLLPALIWLVVGFKWPQFRGAACRAHWLCSTTTEPRFVTLFMRLFSSRGVLHQRSTAG